MITKNKIRIAFISLMYILFVSLWADSLYDQEQALKVIAIHERQIQDMDTKLNRMGAMYHVLHSSYMDINHRYDSLSDIMVVKDNYINGFGYDIDWVKAQQIYESNTNIQAFSGD